MSDYVYDPNDELVSLGTFKNEYGELFVVLKTRHTNKVFITGDETSWIPVTWGADFLLDQKEMDEIRKILAEA